MESHYRDPRPLARTVILWTWIWLAMQSLYALACVYHFIVLAGLPPDTPVTFSYSPPELETADMVAGVAGLLHLSAFLVSGFFILKWIHRTNANAQLYTGAMTVSPGWNVGFFFIPIANLWKPFQGVRETWEASHRTEGPAPSWMRWWWACWLATNILGNISFRIAMQGETAGAAGIGSIIDVISAAIGVPLALLLVRLVRDISAAQEEMHHARTFE